MQRHTKCCVSACARRGFDDGVQLPVRSFIPNEASRDIHLPVLVEIADSHPFAAELGVELVLLKTDLWFVFRSANVSRQTDEPHNDEANERIRHGLLSFSK